MGKDEPHRRFTHGVGGRSRTAQRAHTVRCAFFCQQRDGFGGARGQIPESWIGIQMYPTWASQMLP